MVDPDQPVVFEGHSRPMRVREPEAVVASVEPDSIAEQLGLVPGDRIRRLNGQAPRDLIDWQLWCAAEEIDLLVEHADGEAVLYSFEKDEHEDLGVQFESMLFTPLRTCNNGCLFCFVEQAPPGLRPTVYVRDDDYRLSFLGGHFTTLTNLTEQHFERIVYQHLSPLYVSVHASDPAVRERLLGNAKARAGWEYLRRLVAAGLECHTQVVVCPGINDGAQLDRTIGDLVALGPGVLSIGVVPVGLTRYSAQPELRAMTAGEARATVRQLADWRERVGRAGRRRVYAADELFLLSDEPCPAAEYYDDYPQIENGIGPLRLFGDQAAVALRDAPRGLATPTTVWFVTGEYGAQALAGFVDQLNRINQLDVVVQVVRNELFGGNVKCSGLLGGQDLLEQVSPPPAGSVVVLPGRAVDERARFLDGVTVGDLAAAWQVPVHPCWTPDEVVAHAVATGGGCA